MRLNRNNFPKDRQIGASAPQETGIVHIGLAQFHRAHAAIATAQALAVEPGPWGIVGVASHSHKIVDAMREQDGLYSLLQLTPEGESVRVVDVHRDFAVAGEDPDAVIALLARPEHKIITMTVSEVAYHKDPSTGRLDRANADVSSDLAGNSPRTTIGLIARGLLKRFDESGAPVTVLSCDNMVSAGNTTKALITEFLEAVGVPEGFFEWLGANVTFPNAMVDRIVPGTTDETREAVTRIAGFEDAVPVPAEGFTMWVLEDKFAAGRPAWEHAEGVTFTDEVEKYELVKLRLLNGSHSLISYLGGLDGRDTIPASRTQDFVEECVRNALYDEYLPSIDLPSGFDPDAYISQLFVRWTNFELGDKTARVGSDGSAKLVQRIPEPAIRLLKNGVIPQQMALTAAAWMACVCPPKGFAPGPIADAMIEPKRELLASVTAEATTVREHVSAILDAGVLPSELVAFEAFRERVIELVELIVAEGVRAAAADACAKRLVSFE